MPTPTWLADKGIDLSQSFTMTLSVGLDNVVHYYINSIEVCTATLGAGYNPEFYS
ncbi:hypothetical protein [Faecalibaculum rodentium]|nr:hypothetical protein [Faecalibaculum rodentium]